ncbi:putative signal transducing protein [Idiomarina fontislapidosi]|uniref:RanBP2-type domain-containing protein n=1 Tax=Idiomarina fontislapidosi TaxID=263723 RepID=A0A432XP48_9GAMM|nr:DUF2007 domain-containing protein [Idiomarina fontislapidosi]PYE30573.1 putative signal transducing protein [Idiomarina fontislapidosi]RUO50467.1 hypothetical protein CWE25_12160 [Idiomarina fontislapidosi]|tara:strand:+ start:4806 stop:5132 length:327 start_codon:yes stop_codon:yes gene_type:complete
MSDQWIKIYRASSPIEAELLGGLLRAEGIKVHIPNNPSAGGVGELPADAIETAIYVLPQSTDAAKQILTVYEQNSANNAEWCCSACGELNPASFEECWQCQQERPTTD